MHADCEVMASCNDETSHTEQGFGPTLLIKTPTHSEQPRRRRHICCRFRYVHHCRRFRPSKCRDFKAETDWAVQWAEGMIFKCFLTEGRVPTMSEMPMLTRDEYLGGVLDFAGELNRHAVLRATERDTAAVRRCRDVIDALMGVFLGVRAPCALLAIHSILMGDCNWVMACSVLTLCAAVLHSRVRLQLGRLGQKVLACAAV